jgi:hypothetical protein
MCAIRLIWMDALPHDRTKAGKAKRRPVLDICFREPKNALARDHVNGRIKMHELWI